jgi:DNA-directed RNA polymerase specialized sigma24 family protein
VGNRRADKGAAAKPIEKDPDKLAVLLLAYAFRYAASVGWKAQDRAIARGEGLEDIVQDALASLYGGEPDRRWDPVKTPDPMDHLRSFVNSRLSSLARSYDHKKVRFPIDPEQHHDVDNPESLVMEKQKQQEEDAWWKRAKDLLLNEILGDELLLAMHDLMEKEEIDKPAELAARLNQSVETVKNAKKRIKRAWERVIAAIGPHPALAKEGTHG